MFLLGLFFLKHWSTIARITSGGCQQSKPFSYNSLFKVPILL